MQSAISPSNSAWSVCMQALADVNLLADPDAADQSQVFTQQQYLKKSIRLLQQQRQVAPIITPLAAPLQAESGSRAALPPITGEVIRLKAALLCFQCSTFCQPLKSPVYIAPEGEGHSAVKACRISW